VLWQQELAAMTPENQKKYCEADCRVDLLEENEEAATIYMITRGQVVTMGEHGIAIDINISAVKAAMDIYGVADQRECLQKVMKLFHHFRESQVESG